MNDNLLRFNGLTKVRRARRVDLDYEVQGKDEVELSVEVEEFVINNGDFAAYEWEIALWKHGTKEYASIGSSTSSSDIYEDALMFFLFIKCMEGIVVTTWDMVRIDFNEFFGKIELN